MVYMLQLIEWHFKCSAVAIKRDAEIYGLSVSNVRKVEVGIIPSYAYITADGSRAAADSFAAAAVQWYFAAELFPQ